MSNKRIVVIGATSAIAEQCARLWLAESPAEIVLVGRNLEKVDAIAADLRVRNPITSVKTVESDFLDPAAIGKLADEISKEPIDIVLIAHGSLPIQEDCQSDLQATREALEVNGVSPVLFAEAFISTMQKRNRGTVAIIGSVAGERGRKSNYVYGSAKGLVTRYTQGLQHRLAQSNVKVVLIKPGPTDTPMTANMKQTGAKLARVDHVAQDIVRGIAKGKTVIYTPKIWSIIMMVIRHLPTTVFNRMDI